MIYNNQYEFDKIKSHTMDKYNRVKRDKTLLEMYNLLIENTNIEHSKIVETILTRSMTESKLLHLGRRTGATTALALEIVISVLSGQAKILVVVPTQTEKNNLFATLKVLTRELDVYSTNHPVVKLVINNNQITILSKDQLKAAYLCGMSKNCVFIDRVDMFNYEELRAIHNVTSDSPEVKMVLTTSAIDGFKYAFLFSNRPYTYFKIPTMCRFKDYEEYNKFVTDHIIDKTRLQELELEVK